MESPSPKAARRPLKSRQAAWAKTLASWLTRAGVRPNHISLLSILFAAAAAAALYCGRDAEASPRIALFFAAAAGIQLRLLCNLLDGMVAVEGGMKTKTGELYNDIPDRIADALIFVAAGYSLTWPGYGPELGWTAALLAVMTAYVRVLGGSVGVTQYFIGPAAKQQRMAILTGACLLGIAETALARPPRILAIALAVIIAGEIVTLVRRVARIARDMEAR
ncbi:MAG TPA: CDP-alcohol phosphatidyltransferase family protein [Terriglobales bacterium]|nr:CDP-alcohol phosphatidyltransferase family protein [Terriglobales bacterium]